jgi:hypothetical protein
VAGIDGKPVEAPIGIALSIDATTIRFEPVCAGFSWHYRYKDGLLETWRSSEGPRPAPGSTPPPVCAVAVLPEQRALATAIRAATRAVRTPANAVELSGGGHAVTLFSQ